MRIVIALLFACASLPASAQGLVSSGESFLAARLDPGVRGADGVWDVGLTLTMAPGWKTYWRAPGEVGIPPGLDWSGSHNLGAVEIAWPRPTVFESFGATTLGYGGTVTLPIRVTPQEPGAPVDLRLALALGVCREICVLEETSVALDLGPATAPSGAAAIEAGRALVPAPGAALGITAQCRVVGAGKERRLEAEVRLPAPLAHPHVVVEGPEDTWFSAVETVAQGATLQVAARVTTARADAWLTRDDLRLTVLGDGVAAELLGCDAPPG